MKRVYVYMAISVFVITFTLLFIPNLNAADENGVTYPETIIGQVTSVGQKTFTIKEDRTQTEYTLSAPRSKLKDISTGYRVEVKTTGGGAVSSLTILGMPMQIEPDPEQKWKVIKYPEASPAAYPTPSPATNP